MSRDWGDVSGFPVDPTPTEVLDNVRRCAEAIVANCRALPTLATLEGAHRLHETNAVLGRCIFERATLLRAGNGATALRAWADERESRQEGR